MHPRRLPTRQVSRHHLARKAPRSSPLQVYDLHSDLIEYQVAWKWQKQYAKLLAESRDRQTIPEALAVLQHEPVYTLGAGSSLENVKFDLASPPYPLFRTERGGEVTFHGPGQLTVYPILDLKQYGQDLHKYLRDLEEVVIVALGRVSGIDAFRIEGLTGGPLTHASAVLTWGVQRKAAHVKRQKDSATETRISNATQK